LISARRSRPKCRHVFTLVAVLFIVPASVDAQSRVTLTGTVSETVTLSVAPAFAERNVEVVSIGVSTVRITLHAGATDPVIRVPLLVRSNTSFKISATFDSTAIEPSKVLVTDVHPTGSLVSPHIVNAIDVNRKADLSQPLLIVTGPRVSIGGTLQSPNNALQITVLIHLSPQLPHGLVNLTFVGSPAR